MAAVYMAWREPENARDDQTVTDEGDEVRRKNDGFEFSRTVACQTFRAGPNIGSGRFVCPALTILGDSQRQSDLPHAADRNDFCQYLRM